MKRVLLGLRCLRVTMDLADPPVCLIHGLELFHAATAVASLGHPGQQICSPSSSAPSFPYINLWAKEEKDIKAV